MAEEFPQPAAEDAFFPPYFDMHHHRLIAEPGAQSTLEGFSDLVISQVLGEDDPAQESDHSLHYFSPQLSHDTAVTLGVTRITALPDRKQAQVRLKFCVVTSAEGPMLAVSDDEYILARAIGSSLAGVIKDIARQRAVENN